jgi:hypothetical protein
MDLSIAIRKHHDPAIEDQVCVICPRRKGKPTEPGGNGTSPVALSLEFLRPYFKKPLTQVSEELGLSATAIKKACRRFGVPKWPYRTLTSKTSRNRSSWGVAYTAPYQRIADPSQQQTSGSSENSAQGPSFSQRQDAARQTEDGTKLEEDAKMMKEVAALEKAQEAGAKKSAEAKQLAHAHACSEALQDQELSAARNLSLLSATIRSHQAAPAPGTVAFGELQVQAIRAWQNQQMAIQEAGLQHFALNFDGSLQPVDWPMKFTLPEATIKKPISLSAATAIAKGKLPKLQTNKEDLLARKDFTVQPALPPLPSLHTNFLLPQSNLLSFGFPAGAHLMCPVSLSLSLTNGAQLPLGFHATFPGVLPWQMFIPPTATPELVSSKLRG